MYNNKFRYIEYDNNIYILCGIVQDKFLSLYFRVVDLKDIKVFISNPDYVACQIIPTSNANEITDRNKLDLIRVLYE